VNSANAAFQVMHVHHTQAVFSAEPGKINYNGAPSGGPNEARVFFWHEPLLTVSVRPSTMADNTTMGDCDHV
jgi:hypothetical protein